MKKYLFTVACFLLIILGTFGLYYFMPRATPPMSPPELIGSTFEESILQKSIGCDKFCKERYAKQGYNIIGRLKSSPDGENLICNCYQKKLKTEGNKTEI